MTTPKTEPHYRCARMSAILTVEACAAYRKARSGQFTGGLRRRNKVCHSCPGLDLSAPVTPESLAK